MSALVFALAAMLTATLALGGCSTSIGDMPIAGSDASAQQPKDPSGYLPVHDLPPARDEAVIPPDERAKIQKELIAARDRQAVATPPATATKDASGK